MINPIGHVGMRGLNKLLRLRTTALLIVFSLADLVAVLLYWFYRKGVLDSRFFRLSRDRGFGELVQYGKLGLIILMLTRWNRVRGAKLLTAWVILFAIILADDAIGLHEEIGGWLMWMIDFPSLEVVRTKDIAEAIVFAMLEGSACIYLIFRYFQAPRDLRAYSRGLGLAMVALVFFGLVLDILPFHTFEQPGQMVAMSILLGFVHLKYRKGANENSGRGAVPK